MGCVLNLCGGFNWKTGGLIIGYLELICSAIYLLAYLGVPLSVWFGVAFWVFAVSVAWLYGIHASKPNYMVTSLATTYIAVIVFYTGTIVAAIYAIFGWTTYQISGSDIIKLSILPSHYSAGLALTRLIWAVSLIAFWYIMKVKATLYTKMTCESVTSVTGRQTVTSNNWVIQCGDPDCVVSSH